MTPARWREVGSLVDAVRLSLGGGAAHVYVAADAKVYVAAPSDRCPHGDPTCPCQDAGDPCNYEGANAMDCPNPPLAPQSPYHCHVEGCEQRMGTMAVDLLAALDALADVDLLGMTDGHPCALTSLGHDHPLMHPEDPAAAQAFMVVAHVQQRTMLDTLRGTPSWQCGLRRSIAAAIDEGLPT